MGMELKIYNPTDDGFVKEIEWNHEEIKKEVERQLSFYKDLVYTEAQIKDAKADRAKLRKFVDSLESKRKEIKALCLAPYNKFEEQMKQIIALVNEPINLIDAQVKEYESVQKEEKKTSIRDLFDTIGFQPCVTVESIWDEKWLNASVSMKKIEEQMKERMVAIGNDVMTIHNLPEFSFEAMEEYKRTLDLGRAIQEGQRLADIQKRKQEHEAELARMQEEVPQKPDEAQQEQMKDQAFVPPVIDEELERKAWGHQETVPEDDKQWISFKALLTMDNATALKEFFESRSIEYQAI